MGPVTAVLVIPTVRLPRGITGFTYSVPADLASSIREGSLVRVPFRRATVTGVVWSLTPPPLPRATRAVLEVLPGFLSTSHRAFLSALADAHLTSPSAFLRLDGAPPSNVTGKPGSIFLHYLGPEATHVQSLETIAGDTETLVVAVGAEAEGLASRGARWYRGADAALLEPSGFDRPTVLYREESSAHRRRTPPYLDTRAVAVARAQYLGRPLTLTAQCPRTETVLRVQQQSLRALNQPPPLPPANVRTLARTPFTDPSVIELLRAAVESGGSAFVWVPSRGFAGSMGCVDCGHIVRCDRCGTPLGMPRPGELVCGSCGTDGTSPDRCPRCGSLHLSERSRGLNGVIAGLRRTLPNLPILSVSAREAPPPAPFRGILVGTYARIPLLARYAVRTAVVYALERHLGLPDFRAEERFAQHLTALRFALEPGGNLAFLSQDGDLAARWVGDPRLRIAELLPERRASLYPPFVRLVRISGNGPETIGRFSAAPGVRRVDQLPDRGGVLLRVDPLAWRELVPVLTALPRGAVVEPDWERSEG